MGKNPFQQYIVHVEPGERIFTEGDIGTTMFVVQAGTVRLFREQGGKELGTMEKGDFFGEMSVLEGLPRTSSAEAVEKCDLIEINSMTFDRMIRGNIEIAVRLLRKLSIRLRKSETLIEELQASLSEASAPRPVEAVPADAPVPVAAAAPAAAPDAPATPMPVATIAEPAAASAAPPVVAPAAGKPAAGKPAVGTLSHPPLPASVPMPPRPAIGGATPRSQAAKKGPRLADETGSVVFPLHESESLIGRYDPVTETQPEVDLTQLDIKRSVSRRHARVTVANGNFFITEEVGALNGTSVNGTRLETGRPSPLKDGDRVALGTVELVFHL